MTTALDAPPTVADPTKQVPAAAFTLCAAIDAEQAFALGDPVEDDAARPVTLVALSGKPVRHWYWGEIVLDLSGMKTNKRRIPLDWCHEADEVIGYLNKFDTASDRLQCMGAVTPVSQGDRASTVIAQSEAGVPFESSVFWDDPTIEYLPIDVTAEVNGATVRGPAYIVSKWTLRGVAVCPHGVDPNTSTKFANGAAERAVTIHPKGATAMSQPETKPDTDTTAATTAEEPTPAPESPEQAAAPDTPAEQPAADAAPSSEEAPGKKFMDAFGKERGALYFAEGLSFEQACQAHMKWQAEQIDQLKKSGPTKPEGEQPAQFAAGEDQQGSPNKFASLVRLQGREPQKAA